MYQSDVTLKKISILSGFSISTVSKALNHKDDISEETKHVILTIAKEQNYKPNYSALSLRKRETKTLGIILPEISNLFYGKLLSEMEKIGSSKGFRLLILQSFSIPKKEKECFKLICDGSVDGVLVLSSNNNDCLIKIKDGLNVPPYLFFKVDEEIDGDIDFQKLAQSYFDSLLKEVGRDY